MQAQQPLTSQQMHLPRYAVETAVTSCGVHAEIRRVQWDMSEETELRSEGYQLNMELARFSKVDPVIVAAENRKLLTTGNCLFVPDQYQYSLQAHEIDGCVLCCTFDLKALELSLGSHFDNRPLFACFNIKNPRIRYGMNQLAEELINPSFASDLIIETTTIALIVELVRACSRQAEDYVGGKLSPQQLQLIQERVKNTSGSFPSARELAIDCGFSTRHLMHLFKNSTGQSLHDYIAEERINQAKKLLANRHTLIKNVAYACGFQSQEAFATAFRKGTGLSPRAFRQILTNGLASDFG